MGDIADMMLEGILCEGCGVFIGDGDGFPGLCGICAKDRRTAGHEIRDTGLGYYQDITPITGSHNKPNPQKMNCPECGKRIKKAGFADHKQAVHGVQQ